MNIVNDFLRNMVFSTAALLAMSSSGFSGLMLYSVNMSGPNESPPNASPGIGSGFITIDDVANTMKIQISYSGLTGTSSLAHIHAATATPLTGASGVATSTFAGFPFGVFAGTYDNSATPINLAGSGLTSAYITANGGTAATATSAFISAANSGRAYFNLHSSTFGGGEIRGFLISVPEPSSLVLSGIAIGFAASRRRRIKQA